MSAYSSDDPFRYSCMQNLRWTPEFSVHLCRRSLSNLWPKPISKLPINQLPQDNLKCLKNIGIRISIRDGQPSLFFKFVIQPVTHLFWSSLWNGILCSLWCSWQWQIERESRQSKNIWIKSWFEKVEEEILETCVIFGFENYHVIVCWKNICCFQHR